MSSYKGTHSSHMAAAYDIGGYKLESYGGGI